MATKNDDTVPSSDADGVEETNKSKTKTKTLNEEDNVVFEGGGDDDDDDDDDEGTWGDVKPPPPPPDEDGGEDGSNINAGEDVDEAIEVVASGDKGAAIPTAVASPVEDGRNNHEGQLLSRLDVCLNMGFAKEELPLWGYFVASFVFLFAAVAMKPRKTSSAVRRHLQPGSFDPFADLYFMDDQWAYDDDFALAEIFGAGSLANYVGLPKPAFTYAIFVGIIGMLLSGALIGWMRYNSRAARKLNEGDGDGDEDVHNDTHEDPEAPLDPEGRHLGDATDETGSEGAPIRSTSTPAKPNSELVLENGRPWINGVLFVWAIVAWGYFTVVGGFGGRYVFGHTGNGYFALWAMLLFSLGNAGLTIDYAREAVKTADFCIHGLTVASIIVIIELTTGVSQSWFGWKGRPYYGISTYTLIVSVFSLVFGLLTAGFSWLTSGNFRLDPKIRLGFLVGFIVLWIIAAGLSTFLGPFLATGNGYFAVWACVLFAGLALVDTGREISSLYI